MFNPTLLLNAGHARDLPRLVPSFNRVTADASVGTADSAAVAEINRDIFSRTAEPIAKDAAILTGNNTRMNSADKLLRVNALSRGMTVGEAFSQAGRELSSFADYPNSSQSAVNPSRVRFHMDADNNNNDEDVSVGPVDQIIASQFGYVDRQRNQAKQNLIKGFNKVRNPADKSDNRSDSTFDQSKTWQGPSTIKKNGSFRATPSLNVSPAPALSLSGDLDDISASQNAVSLIQKAKTPQYAVGDIYNALFN